jgi:threonine dehydratase
MAGRVRQMASEGQAGRKVLSFDRVHTAGKVLRPVVRYTDVIEATGLLPEQSLCLKTENLQITGSFKLRGAFFKMSRLSAEERARGVVACSAGNHAQGVGFAARHFGIDATIFLPAAAPISKIEATRAYGAKTKLSAGVYDDAYREAMDYALQTGAVFIHPFDDEDIIAGQATIGLELMEQIPDLEAVVVPIGGGGLAAGVAFAIKRINPACAVYGVQASGADSMWRSLDEGNLTGTQGVSTFADGIAVKVPGQLTFGLCQDHLDGIVTVSDDEIAAAILALIERQKLVVEGAGAAAVAALLACRLELPGKKVCALLSGGNIDVNILSRVINRGLMTSGRLSNLTIALTDSPGQLRDVSAVIAREGANIIRVNYNYGSKDMAINDCFIEISMETTNFAQLQRIRQALCTEGFLLA